MALKRLIIIPIVAALVVVGGLVAFGAGRYVPPNTPPPDVSKIPVPSYTISSFSDAPRKSRGTLLVDEGHFNIFGQQEISILLSRIAARGYDIKFVGSLSSPSNTPEVVKENEKQLEEKLRGADSYLVVLPWNEFTARERELVRAFVQRGGRVVLVGDPTRRSTINSVAQDFGIIFSDDFLYNVKEHEANYRYIYLRDFVPNQITKGLKSVVFYIASSITPESGGLVFTDSNTFSSTRERSGHFSPLVQAAGGRMIAISDLTFMGAPYNGVADNDQLVSNIADYLTTSERVFSLSEFPDFFRGQVDVLSGRDDVLPGAQSLISLVNAPNRVAMLKDQESFLNETVFVGLWQDAGKVDQYLSGGGIQIGSTVTTPFGQTKKQGTALIFLHENQGRHMLIILGDTKDTVAGAVNKLSSGEFRQGLVSDNLGIYQIAGPAAAK